MFIANEAVTVFWLRFLVAGKDYDNVYTYNNILESIRAARLQTFIRIHTDIGDRLEYVHRAWTLAFVRKVFGLYAQWWYTPIFAAPNPRDSVTLFPAPLVK